MAMIDEESHYYEPSEYQKVGEDLARMEMTAEQLCGMGYRAAVMTTIENIIRDNKLDRFGK